MSLADRGHEVPRDQLLVVRRRARAAEGGEALVHDALAEHKIFVVGGGVRGLPHADVEFDLVHGDRDRRHLLHVLHMMRTVVGHPDSLGPPGLGPGLQGLPLLLPALHPAVALCVRREVDQEQVHVGEVQLLEAVVQVLLGARGVEAPHDLGGHEVLLPGQADLGQGLADADLVPIHRSSIHVAVPQLERVHHRLLRHSVVVLPGPEPIQRHAHGPVHPLHGDGGEIRGQGGGSGGKAGGDAHGLGRRWCKKTGDFTGSH
mmetsp:Transcript_88844/g.237794  ORF Transcript_88844/g.237794 Transcript_88844/m.237794 type:complete len:260 (-) Transcript_88844:8-787(-)